MAKARASFNISDMVDQTQRKKKYNQIFYICIMIGLAQMLKACAEYNYVENFVDKVENKVDHSLFNKTSHHHGPIVKSAHNETSLDDIIDER